jgi:hypothetical protein
VVVIAMVLLLVWLLTRDREVLRTSFGFHVERTRVDDGEVWRVDPLPPPTPPPPLPRPPEDVTEAWPARDEPGR